MIEVISKWVKSWQAEITARKVICHFNKGSISIVNFNNPKMTRNSIAI